MKTLPDILAKLQQFDPGQLDSLYLGSWPTGNLVLGNLTSKLGSWQRLTTWSLEPGFLLQPENRDLALDTVILDQPWMMWNWDTPQRVPTTWMRLTK